MYPPGQPPQQQNVGQTTQTQLQQGQVAQQQQNLQAQRQGLAQQAAEEQRKRALGEYQLEEAQDKAHFLPTVMGQEKQLFGKLMGMTPWGTVPGGPGGGGPGAVPSIAYPNLAPGQEAAFARAKDKAALTGQSALTGLQQALAARGMLGSGVEAGGIQDIVKSGMGQLGDLTREQAIQQTQAAQKAAETSYQGAITQRGQDIDLQKSREMAAIEAWKAQQEALRGLMGSLGLNMNIGY